MWTGVSTQIFTKPLLGEMKSSVRREWGSYPEFHSYSIVPAPHMLGESGLGGCDSGFPGLSHVLDKHLFLLNLSEGCSIRVNETLMTRYAYEQHIRVKVCRFAGGQTLCCERVHCVQKHQSTLFPRGREKLNELVSK